MRDKAEGKVLKICLAMGGGVSLGAFSGAAVTEALKLLVLYGQDKKGNKYDTVILDGMSGASAGAITLAILTRCLIDYESMINIKEVNDLLSEKLSVEDSSLDIETLKSPLDDHLIEIYKDDFKNLNEDKKGVLRALEVAQIVQEAIWVHSIDSEKLLRNKSSNKLKPFSLLNREEIIQLTKKYFISSFDNNAINVNNKKLLSDRVLLAFSMANLSPLLYGDKGIVNKEDIPKAVQNIQKVTNIYNHNELRVFDFWFTEIKKENEESRFIKIESNEKSFKNNPEQNNWYVNNKEAWSVIASTAIASGAFPIGFEPVVLERYDYEYSKKDWIADGKKSLHFAYVDGGTFNNEPIKEAFNLGYFQDFQSNSLEDINSDRLILFVDPSVPDEVRVHQLKSLDPLSELKNETAPFKNKFEKLADYTTDLLRMIHTQSNVNEEAKITAFYQSAKLSMSMMKFYADTQNVQLESLIKSKLFKQSFDTIGHYLNERYISIGTRDIKELVFKYYTILCAEGNTNTCLTKESFKKFFNNMSSESKANRNLVDSLMDRAAMSEVDFKDNKFFSKQISLIASAIFMTIFDSTVNLIGKSPKAERVGIFPINEKGDIQDLPGSELAAFGGFGSIHAREACFAKGRLDSYRCLIKEDFRKYHLKSLDTASKDDSEILGFIREEDSILSNFASIYKKLDLFWVNTYFKDLKQSFRKSIFTRLNVIINDFLASGHQNNVLRKVGNMFKKYYILKYIRRKLSEKNLYTYALKNQNIALKFCIDMEKCDQIKINLVNNTIIDIKAENSIIPALGENKKFLIFKLYLSQRRPVLDMHKVDFLKDCYITIDTHRYNNFSMKNEVKNILTNKKSGIEISAQKILGHFKDSSNDLVYGINPITLINLNGIGKEFTTFEFSHPLHKEFDLKG